MRNINELIGIIKGINFDGVINDKEIVRLQSWVDKNRNLAYEKKQVVLINLVDSALKDRMISDEERKQLLFYSKQYLDDVTDEAASIYELNGIVDGIVCDGVLNTEEICKLQQWMSEKGNSVRGHKPSEEILTLVEDILSDGVVTESEKEQLLKLLNNRINDIQLQTKLNHMRRLVKERKNIGLDLIDILDNEEAMDIIHRQAIRQLSNALQSYSDGWLSDPEIVFISLCLIGMLEYDGNFYDGVRTTYSDLYGYYSEQKIEGTIRTILSRYRKDEENRKGKSRIINVALSNAIVPSCYLPAFFEFIFDIYKLNFEYDLSDDLQEEFEFVYDGLRDSMLSDDDNIQINVTRKSYKLIKTTKQLIVDGQYLDSVIKLSIIVIRFIDKRIWDKEVKIFNPYLKKGFNAWEKTLRDVAGGKRKRETSEIRSRWEPRLRLRGHDIFLEAPIHRVKAQYNYREIFALVKNGEKVIYRNDKPDIREIIGGYEVAVNSVALNAPLGEITYLLMAGKTVIYSSKEKLYREFIVFDEKGNELQNNNDYKGTVILCATENELKGKIYFRSHSYGLSVMSVGYGDTLLVGGELFSFSSLIKPGIFGEEISGQYLRKDDAEELLPVFSKIKFLVFECTEDTEKFEISVNNHSSRLSDYDYTRTPRNASWKFVVDISLDSPGVYDLCVYEIFDGKRSRIASFLFGYDPGFKLEEIKIDDNTFVVQIQSGLYPTPVEKEIDINNFDSDWFRITSGGENYVYYVPLLMDFYRIQGENWRPMSESLWIEDIKQDTVLQFYGSSVEGVMIYSDSGILLQEEILTKNCGTHTEIRAGFLQSFKQANDYVALTLLKGGRVYAWMLCYNHCVFHQESTEINFYPITKNATVVPDFSGRGNIIFEVTDEDGTLVFEDNNVKSGVPLEIDGLQSFTRYQFRFYEKAKGLILKKSRDLMILSEKFYDREDFCGRYFRIKEVQYDQLVRGEFLRKTHYFNFVYVYFSEQISNDVFRGKIIVKTAVRSFELFDINPVDIEICGDVVNDELELSITKDGDGLLLDFEHHGIMNTMEDNRAVDIFSYMIDANGEEALWRN